MTDTKPVMMLSSCETSLFTNGASDAQRTVLNRTANTTVKSLTSEEKRLLDTLIAERKRALLGNSDLQTAARMSAEIAGILAYYGGSLSSGRDMHFLVYSDTYQGKAAAEIVEKWLRNAGFSASCVHIHDLRTSSLEDFTSAMHEIIPWCRETIPGNYDKGYKIVFNLTGGFKAMQGFLQTIGMLYADEVVYIFERSDSLLRIPRLPVSLDPEVFWENLQLYRRLGAGYTVDGHECDGIPETLLMNWDGEATFSVWGDLLWSEYKPKIYDTDLLDPISANIVYSDRFTRDVQQAGLAKDRMRMLSLCEIQTII